MTATTAPLARELTVAASHEVLRQHARSFSWAAPFLPRAARDDAAIAYAFCRLVDDTADEAPTLAHARSGLDAIEREVRGEAPARDVVRAYLEVEARRAIPPEAALELLAGARSDVADGVTLPVRAALDVYCWRVAGTVGLMMRGIVGARGAASEAPAVSLGCAMQLTNICRDVAEDAGRGRVYLPADLLAAHGATPAEVLAQPAQPAALAVVRALLDDAERGYAEARAGLAAIPWRARIGVAVALRLYRAIGVEVLRRARRLGPRALETRAVVPLHRKVLEVVRGVCLALTVR